MSSGLIAQLEGLFTGPYEWVKPWAEEVLSKLQPGENPWDVGLPALQDHFYPRASSTFTTQLWVLMGVFSVSAAVILAGLCLRLMQGRFWLIHRIDGTFLIPNISVCYSLCALVYAALGMVNIVDAVRIAEGQEYPRRYIGLQGVWPAVLWLGLYTEIWSTFVAFFIRRYGAYRQMSGFKSALATVAPFVFPILAIVPGAVLFVKAAGPFNSAVATYGELRPRLQEFQRAWTPEAGLDVTNILSVLSPISDLARNLLIYAEWQHAGFIFEASILLVTFFIYSAGAYLEISHLRRQASALRARAALSPAMRQKDSPSPEKAAIAALDEEWFTGVKRQAQILDWAATNRTWTAAFIAIMLLENSGLCFWYGLAPLSIQNNSTQFQGIILVSCWVNGILSTLVALLILFRSLDGGSTAAQRLQNALPWLPLPPAVGLRNATSQRTQTRIEKETYAGKSEVTEESVWGQPLPSQSEMPSFGRGMVQLEMQEEVSSDEEKR